MWYVYFRTCNTVFIYFLCPHGKGLLSFSALRVRKNLCECHKRRAQECMQNALVLLFFSWAWNDSTSQLLQVQDGLSVIGNFPIIPEMLLVWSTCFLLKTGVSTLNYCYLELETFPEQSEQHYKCFKHGAGCFEQYSTFEMFWIWRTLCLTPQGLPFTYP